MCLTNTHNLNFSNIKQANNTSLVSFCAKHNHLPTFPIRVSQSVSH